MLIKCSSGVNKVNSAVVSYLEKFISEKFKTLFNQLNCTVILKEGEVNYSVGWQVTVDGVVFGDCRYFTDLKTITPAQNAMEWLYLNLCVAYQTNGFSKFVLGFEKGLK